MFKENYLIFDLSGGPKLPESSPSVSKVSEGEDEKKERILKAFEEIKANYMKLVKGVGEFVDDADSRTTVEANYTTKVNNFLAALNSNLVHQNAFRVDYIGICKILVENPELVLEHKLPPIDENVLIDLKAKLVSERKILENLESLNNSQEKKLEEIDSAIKNLEGLELKKAEFPQIFQKEVFLKTSDNNTKIKDLIKPGKLVIPEKIEFEKETVPDLADTTKIGIKLAYLPKYTDQELGTKDIFVFDSEKKEFTKFISEKEVSGIKENYEKIKEISEILNRKFPNNANLKKINEFILGGMDQTKSNENWQDTVRIRADGAVKYGLENADYVSAQEGLFCFHEGAIRIFARQLRLLNAKEDLDENGINTYLKYDEFFDPKDNDSWTSKTAWHIENNRKSDVPAYTPPDDEKNGKSKVVTTEHTLGPDKKEVDDGDSEGGDAEGGEGGESEGEKEGEKTDGEKEGEKTKVTEKLIGRNIRYVSHPEKKLSDTEISTMIMPNLVNCEKIIEEMMRLSPMNGVNTEIEYRKKLKTILENPEQDAESLKVYNDFKKTTLKFGNISDISMLQDIAFYEAINEHGTIPNLTQIQNLGFRPNASLSDRLESNIPSLDYCSKTYNQLYGILEKQKNDLEKKTNKSDVEKNELQILINFLSNSVQFQALIKDLAENYRDFTAQKAKNPYSQIAYNYLAKDLNSMDRSSDSFLSSLPKNAETMEEKLALAYKFILASKSVFVPRVVEYTKASGPDDEKEPDLRLLEKEKEKLNKAREKYAKNRRSMSKFMWFRRASKDKLDESREDYLEAMNSYILNTVLHEFPSSEIVANNVERNRDMKNRLLELTNNERKALFDEEMKAQLEKESTFGMKTWNKFKNGWKKHKKLRLIAGVGLLVGGLVSGNIALLGVAAGLRAVGTYMGTTSIWEGIRNRFGKTKKLDNEAISKMAPNQVTDGIAAQITLAMSEKTEITDSKPLSINNRPVNEKEFRKREEPEVSKMFSTKNDISASDAMQNETYRQESARKLWDSNNQTTRDLIDQQINQGSNIAGIVGSLLAKEEDLMKSVEERETYIRKNNFKKHITAGALAGFSAFGIPAIYNWLNPPPVAEVVPVDVPPVDSVPVDSVPVDPSPVDVPPVDPVPVDSVPVEVPELKPATFEIPRRLDGPYIGNRDIAEGLVTEISGRKFDESVGLYQSLAGKLGLEQGSGAIEKGGDVYKAIVADNPDIFAKAHLSKGAELSISPDTAQIIAEKVNASGLYPNRLFSAESVLSDLNKPWDPIYTQRRL